MAKNGIESKLKTVEKAATDFLSALGLDLSEANLEETPRRMAKAYSFMCRGICPEARDELKEILSKRFPTKYKGMIIQEPIRVYSLCSHHLMPVTYDVLFGYVPLDLVLGFSKSVKAIKLLGARPISQEDFTHEIIETFNKELSPKGIMVVVRGIHDCMICRGAETNTINITSAVKGTFKRDEKTRSEFLALAKFNGDNLHF